MSTNALMMVQWDHPCSEAELIPLREALCRDLELSLEDDFYWDGSLLLVSDPNKHYDFGLSNGQQITVPETYCWLNVNIYWVYWDKDHPRGNFPLFLKLAIWLEEHLPGCLLWYGSCCDGILKPFNPSSRADLVAYLDEFGGTDRDTLECLPGSPDFWV